MRVILKHTIVLVIWILFFFGLAQTSFAAPAWISYFGGNDIDYGYAIATDASGNVFITGSTQSTNLPVTTGPAKAALYDAYIAKFTSTGTLLWATYFGGDGFDEAYGIAVDNAGNVIIAGHTQSSDLPNTAGTFQTANANPGLYDGFAAKFDGTTGANLWSTYFGGSFDDRAFAVTTDGSNNVIVTGEVKSSNFPYTPGAFQTAIGSFNVPDVFIAKLNSNGASIWATYYGGSGDDSGKGIKCDAAGNIFVTGYTQSGTMPTPFSGSFGGFQDIFITKFNSGGTPQWGTFYGGSSNETGYGIAIDASSNVIVGGFTGSANYVATGGAFQTTYGGGFYDACVLKYSNTGTLLWSSFFGATNDEVAYGIAVDGTESIYISGNSYSSNLPVTSCPSLQSTFIGTGSGVGDHFIARFDKNGKRTCATYIGGSKRDERGCIATFGSSIFYTGYTVGNPQISYPVTSGAYQTTPGFGNDAIIGQMCGNFCGGTPLSNKDFSSTKTTICKDSVLNFTDLSTNCDTTNTSWLWTFNGATPSSSTLHHPKNINYPTPGTYDVKLVISSPCGKDSITKTALITVNPCGCVSNPTAAINSTQDVLCNGENSGSATANASGGSSTNYTYSWSTNPTQTTSIASGLAQGTYTVKVSDASNCTDTKTVTINEPSPLQLTLTSTSAACNQSNGTASILSISGGKSAYTYTWNSIPTQNSLTASNLSPGIYTATVTDLNGCTLTKSISVANASGSSVNISSTTSILCFNDANATATASASGATSGLSYSWNTNPPQLSATATGLIPGVYIITLTDASNCTSTASITITEPTQLNLDSNSTYPCSGNSNGTASILASGGTSSYSYSWSTFPTQTTQTITGLIPGAYTVLVTDANGCTKSKTIIIGTSPAPIANAGADQTIYTGESATLNASGGNNYNWSPPTNIGCNTCSNTSATPTSTTTYTVLVTNTNGCTAIDSVTINVIDLKCGELFLPTAFSPNNDQVNDTFIVRGKCINNFNLKIFTRWGEKVFETNDATKGWDGSYNGIRMNSGVFIYTLNLTTITGELITKKGNVSLVR